MDPQRPNTNVLLVYALGRACDQVNSTGEDKFVSFTNSSGCQTHKKLLLVGEFSLLNPEKIMNPKLLHTMGISFIVGLEVAQTGLVVSELGITMFYLLKTIDWSYHFEGHNKRKRGHRF